MEQVKTVAKWKKEVSIPMNSKVEEFHLLGYGRATEDDIWNCLVRKVWKGNPEKRVHQVVQDILHLSSHTYTSYLTTEAYQHDDLLASIEALQGSSEY